MLDDDLRTPFHCSSYQLLSCENMAAERITRGKEKEEGEGEEEEKSKERKSAQQHICNE